MILCKKFPPVGAIFHWYSMHSFASSVRDIDSNEPPFQVGVVAEAEDEVVKIRYANRTGVVAYIWSPSMGMRWVRDEE